MSTDLTPYLRVHIRLLVIPIRKHLREHNKLLILLAFKRFRCNVKLIFLFYMLIINRMILKEDMIERECKGCKGLLTFVRFQLTLPNNNDMPSHFSKFFRSSLSRSMLRFIFFSQNSVLVLGITKYLQP